MQTREEGMHSGTGLQTREQGCRLGAMEQTGAKGQTEDFGAEAGDLYQLHIHNHTH